MRRDRLLIFGGAVLGVLIVAGLLFHWSVNRIYVPEGKSLMLRYKGPLIFGSRQTAKAGYWAEEGQIGIRAKLRGPGRHFYCPIWWDRQLVDDVLIKPGEVGVVTCKLGDPLPPGEFLVDGDIGNTTNKGILRKVLHPGRYRVNPYGYEVKTVQTQTIQSEKQAGWVEIPTGYVGVVTQMAARGDVKPGVLDDVLPPGIYPVNGREQQIDIVEIGYRHTTIQAEKLRELDGSLKVDEAGEPLIANNDKGIEFPSSDGFEIHMDFTAIWGLQPQQAPHAIRTIGNISAVEDKIVRPQIESICRNNGSRYKAADLLIGDTREEFQTTNLGAFKGVLKDKEIELLYGLVRHIYIPKEVRKPIQTAFIADELKLTREVEKETAKAEAAFKEAEAGVELASRKVEVETQKLVSEKEANADRQAEQIRAETEKLAAAIRKETATLEAQATQILGEATANAKKLQEEAKSDRFKLAVEAFGTPSAYNNWFFATNLPTDIKLRLLYAGQGTLWTDVSKAGGNFGIRANLPLEKQSKDQKEPRD